MEAAPLTGMDQEAKNRFSEKPTRSPVLYALSLLFLSVTEKANLLFWLLTIKGCSLFKKKGEKGKRKSLRGGKGSVFKHLSHFKNKLFRFTLNTEKIAR